MANQWGSPLTFCAPQLLGLASTWYLSPVTIEQLMPSLSDGRADALYSAITPEAGNCLTSVLQY